MVIILDRILLFVQNDLDVAASPVTEPILVFVRALPKVGDGNPVYLVTLRNSLKSPFSSSSKPFLPKINVAYSEHNHHRNKCSVVNLQLTNPYECHSDK